MTTPALRVVALSKRFGAMEALSKVSFDVNPGEIHALVGENGAGKTTLINILAGVLSPDAGSVEINGRKRDIRSSRRAQELGVATVFQELSVAPSVSVAENIFAGRLPQRRGCVDWTELNAASLALLKDFGVALDPMERLSVYPIGIRQLVEIAKALSLKARVLLLDEPTSALDQNEKAALFAVVRKLAASGLAIVYISHHLNEVFALAERITVLRNGRISGHFRTSEVEPAAVIRAMVGRTIEANTGRGEWRSGAAVLSAHDIVGGTSLSSANLTLHAGEIVALAGLIGSGCRELARTLCGLIAKESGRIEFKDRLTNFRDLREAMKHGIAYVPGERKSEGLFIDIDIRGNICAAVFSKLAKFGIVDQPQQDRLALRFVERLGVKLRDIADRVGQLSGGNQQKVLLAKWLATTPSVLIVEEPTRGVDIAAKYEIHRLLRELADSGIAILVVSSDLPEILGIARRIVVMRHGRTVGEVDAASATEEIVMSLAAGMNDEEGRAAA